MNIDLLFCYLKQPFSARGSGRKSVHFSPLVVTNSYNRVNVFV